MTTTTIATQTVRYYNTRGGITGTETVIGDAVDADYGDVKPVAKHSLNLSAMKTLATSSDPVDRVLVAQQRSITRPLIETLAQDADLDVLWHLGINRAVDLDTYTDGVDPDNPFVRDLEELNDNVGDDPFDVLLATQSVHRLMADMLLAYAASTDVDLLAEMAENHPHVLVRNFAAFQHEYRTTGHIPGCQFAHDDALDDVLAMAMEGLTARLAEMGIEVRVFRFIN